MNQDTVQKLQQWCKKQLAAQESPIIRFEPLAGDASARRYFRLETPDKQLIAVCSPGCTESFSHIAGLLAKAHLPAPRVLAVDHQQGFLLQDDLGHEQLDDILSPANANGYYRRAIDLLINFQQLPNSSLPLHDTEAISEGLARFPEWFMHKLLQNPFSENQQWQWRRTEILLLEAAAQQPQAAVHFDYQSRNLMCNGDALSLIDFQDACQGPVFYDVASLLRDAYQRWPEASIDSWRDYYISQAQRVGILPADGMAQRWFDLACALRGLRVLGTFARLALRDDKPNYLQYIPQVLQHLLASCERQACLTDLKYYVQEQVIPLCRQHPLIPVE